MKRKGILRATSVALAFGLTGAMAIPVFAAPVSWQIKDVSPIVIDSGSSADFTVAGGQFHTTYIQGGHVFYQTRAILGATWTTLDLGVGSSPVVAASGNNVAVGFISAGAAYVATNADAFAVKTNVVSATLCRLAYSGTGSIELITQGRYGGNTAPDFGHFSKPAGGSWSAMDVLAQSFYDSSSRSGNYYYQPAIAGTSTGYIWSFEGKNWGGLASWSSKGVNADGFGHGANWNDPLALTGRAISNGSSGAGVALTHSGTIYAALRPAGGTWGTEQNLGAGDSASVDTNAGLSVAFVGSASLQLLTDESVTPVAFELTNIVGTQPIIVSDSTDRYLAYIDSGGHPAVLSTAVPEPASLSLLALGGLALLGRRRMM